MRLDPTTVLALAATCAPQVSPDTLLAVTRVESGLDTLAIGVNGPSGGRLSSPTPEVALRTAERLQKAGRNFDVGLAQINIRNLPWLGLSLADAFDPCRNLAASAKVLVRDWRLSASPALSASTALVSTLSRYNTGDPQRGVSNGYVARVQASAGRALDARDRTRPPPNPGAPQISRVPAWDVFGDLRAATFVTHSPSTPEGAAP